MNVRLVAPGNPETNRLSSSRKQQSIIRNGVSIRERYLPRSWINAGNLRGESQVDCVFRIERFRPERHPILGRAAGEIIFRQIRAIHGRAASLLSITILPAKFSRRSISAAAKPAAPPPTMTIRSAASPADLLVFDAFG